MIYPSKKMIKHWMAFWITKRKVNEWFSSKKIFFILAIGRSGTQFFANLLNKASHAYVVHEPVGSDFRAYQDAYHNIRGSYSYIEHFRKKEIYIRSQNRDFDTYGEVNSVLRRHCNALKQSFPDATIIHLIRDGRDVVRSMMARKTMTKDDPNTKHIYPLEGDPWKSKWSSMSRFEKLCWYWKTENEYLSLNLKDAIRFEDLISNYNYFHKNLLDPLNLEISEDLWRKEKESPKNVTTNYTLPHWKDWDTETLDSFNNICGEIMKDNNYL